jgi:hypothetical protein
VSCNAIAKAAARPDPVALPEEDEQRDQGRDSDDGRCRNQITA